MPFIENTLHKYVQIQKLNQTLVLQPRMGFSDHIKMKRGLISVRNMPFPTVGTITLDSYTRLCKFKEAEEAISKGYELNGYPIASMSAEDNRDLLRKVAGPDFPVQVRHGSPKPFKIFQAILDAGIDATEGGPISYCIPYGRSPLSESIDEWYRSCSLFAEYEEIRHKSTHVETFGGCMMGHLCPPAMLVAISIIEALFFIGCGISTVSLSYAQGTNNVQDCGALYALRNLADTFLPHSSWHLVLYTFMGPFPETLAGAKKLIEKSARIAKVTGLERLIVKTSVEATHIPTISDNLIALRWANDVQTSAEDYSWTHNNMYTDIITQHARDIIETVLNLSNDLSYAIRIAFKKGILDIPYCLHPDVQNRVTSWIDPEGAIQWGNSGNIPYPRYLRSAVYGLKREISSTEFLSMINYNKDKYDQKGH